jgi:hypothetical protein
MTYLKDSIGNVLKTSAAALTRLDSTHLFVRTADVRCRVDEVENATYQVENPVRQLGGYVNDTRLSTTTKLAARSANRS